jgi:hypothetical protein
MTSFLHLSSACLFLIVPAVAEHQSPVFSNASLSNEFQERRESEPVKGEKGDAQNIYKATERLKRAVNGNSVVKNQCQIQQHSVEVEERTEIVEARGCSLVVKTIKTSNLRDGPQKLRFTFYADLADLSTPASVEPLNFSQCKPAQGALIKVKSRAQPGKNVRTTRGPDSAPGNSQTSSEQQETAAKKDLSFFFSDAAIARRTARALDHAVALCGGKEWPDEDDLP